MKELERDASPEDRMVRIAGLRPAPGRYAIRVRTAGRDRTAGLLNVTDTN